MTRVASSQAPLVSGQLRPTAPLLHIQQQEPSGTEGGTFTSGAWQTRVLNTVLTNEIGGASLSSNQITLPAGTYWIEASAPAYKTDTHKAKLRNTTDASDALIGTSATAAAADGVSSRSFVVGRLSITAEKVFELQHRANTTAATRGFGQGNAAFGVVEVYADIKIWKIA